MGIGLLAFIAASVVHVMIAGFISTLVVIVFFRKRIKINLTRRTLTIGGSLIIGFFLFTILQPDNYDNVKRGFADVGRAYSYSPKGVVTTHTFTKTQWEYPTVLLIGLGPGQYTSKGSLIGSGRYFGRFYNPIDIPFVGEQMSTPFKKYIFPWWEAFQDPAYGSSTLNRPFYSLLSLYAEFGLPAFVFLLIWFVKKIQWLRKLYIYNLPQGLHLRLFLILSCAISIITLIPLSFFENYLETPQVIFPGLILMKFAYVSLKMDFLKTTQDQGNI